MVKKKMPHLDLNIRKRILINMKTHCCLLLLFTIIEVVKADISLSSSPFLSNTQHQQLSDDISSSDNDEDYLPQKEYVLEKSYHGLIRENETLVEITPLIKVDEEKICSFRILKKPFHEIPFEIQMLNNLGILKSRHALNCEKRRNYHFEIVAVFCDGLLSAPAEVHITVVDVNEYSPTFQHSSYATEVDEGYLYKDIIRLEATDNDCSPLYGDICKYEIVNKDQPFIIDNDGSVRNTQPLSYKLAQQHIFTVVAYDCAMKRSIPVMVNIKVRSLCIPKIQNIDEHIHYKPTNIKTDITLFPNAQLELCDISCNSQNMNIRSSVILETNRLSCGCDRQTTIQCMRTNNKKEGKLFNLLSKSMNSSDDWKFNAEEIQCENYHFDGHTGVLVPDNNIMHHDFSSQPFAIITAFRHAAVATTSATSEQNEHDAKHIKEHILCSADDHKMNRHHMALFVRNCRLILLLRKNFNEGDLNIFSPAEWRWKIPQVCDNEWHHYVLNVNAGAESVTKVELYIDGNLFEQSHEERHNNPEIIDDWPLHAAYGVETKLAIGACYQSSEKLLKHAFNGDISKLELSVNTMLSTNVIKCLTECKEHLMAPDENYLSGSTQLQMNTRLNEIYIESQSIHNLQQLLQQIKYINDKKIPTTGQRNIEIRTKISCANQTSISLPNIHAYLSINTSKTATTKLPMLPSKSIKQKPTTTAPLNIDEMLINMQENEAEVNINNDEDVVAQKKTVRQLCVNGMTNKLVSYGEIKQGVRIMEDITFGCDEKLKTKSTITHYFDACNLIIFPALNPDHEDITVFNDELLSNNIIIKTNINKDGVIMSGHDNLNNYLSILHNLVYSNKKPAYYLNRVFKLNCRQLGENQILKGNNKNERILASGEYTLTLTVLHPKQTNSMLTGTTSTPLLGIVDSPMFSDALNHENTVFSHAKVHQQGAEEPTSEVHSILRKVDSSQSSMLIALICLFVVILLSGILIVRMRNNNNPINRHHQPCPKISDEGLLWDDSALTITINPMQSDIISDASTDSENSDSDEDNDVGTSNGNQLEWDNSNIFISSMN